MFGSEKPRQAVASGGQARSQQRSDQNGRMAHEDREQRTTQRHRCVVGMARFFHVG